MLFVKMWGRCCLKVISPSPLIFAFFFKKKKKEDRKRDLGAKVTKQDLGNKHLALSSVIGLLLGSYFLSLSLCFLCVTQRKIFMSLVKF